MMLTVILLTLAIILVGIMYFLMCIWFTLERIANVIERREM